MTNRDKYLAAMTGIFGKALRVSVDRVKKYNPDPEEPFEAVSRSAFLTQSTVIQGVMTRFSDKLSRLVSALSELEKTGQVTDFTDETFQDTFVDAINYLAMLLIWIETDGGENFEEFLAQLRVPVSILDEETAQKMKDAAPQKKDPEQLSLFNRIFSK
jgi:hypothetical protein